MPEITIDLWKVSPETKADLIGKLTKTASEITNLPPPAFFVYVREYPLDAIGTGGVPLAQQNLPPHAPPEQEPLPLAAGGPCASGSGGGIGAKSACWVRMGA